MKTFAIEIIPNETEREKKKTLKINRAPMTGGMIPSSLTDMSPEYQEQSRVDKKYVRI